MASKKKKVGKPKGDNAGSITLFESETKSKKHKIDIQVSDANGRPVAGQDRPGAGVVEEVHCIQYIRMTTRDPGSVCWIQFNGVWYKVC